MQENERENALLEMKAALVHLKKSWFECVNAFSNAFVDCNDYILSNDGFADYPFHKSFDEIGVPDWVDGAIERIDEEIFHVKKCAELQCEIHELERQLEEKNQLIKKNELEIKDKESMAKKLFSETNAERCELFGCLIDVVEDFLEEKGIKAEDIPNPEREENEMDLDGPTNAIIYGSDYDDLADRFSAVLGIGRHIEEETMDVAVERRPLVKKRGR